MINFRFSIILTHEVILCDLNWFGTMLTMFSSVVRFVVWVKFIYSPKWNVWHDVWIPVLFVCFWFRRGRWSGAVARSFGIVANWL